MLPLSCGSFKAVVPLPDQAWGGVIQPPSRQAVHVMAVHHAQTTKRANASSVQLRAPGVHDGSIIPDMKPS